MLAQSPEYKLAILIDGSGDMIDTRAYDAVTSALDTKLKDLSQNPHMQKNWSVEIWAFGAAKPSTWSSERKFDSILLYPPPQGKGLVPAARIPSVQDQTAITFQAWHVKDDFTKFKNEKQQVNHGLAVISSDSEVNALTGSADKFYRNMLVRLGRISASDSPRVDRDRLVRDVNDLFDAWLKWVSGIDREPSVSISRDGEGVIYAGDTVAFKLAGKDLESAEFSFGDGSPSQRFASATVARSLEHEYKSAGEFTATFAGSRGAKTARTGFAVKVLPRPTPPAVTLSVADDGPHYAGAAVRFKSTLPGAAKAEIDYGDGSHAILLTTPLSNIASHTYAKPGTYTVAVDAQGARARDKDRKTVSVKVLPLPPLELMVDDSASGTGVVKVFASAEPLEAVAIDFGDGSASTRLHRTGVWAEHSYDKSRSYTITMRAERFGKAEAVTKSVMVAILPLPPATTTTTTTTTTTSTSTTSTSSTTTTVPAALEPEPEPEPEPAAPPPPPSGLPAALGVLAIIAAAVFAVKRAFFPPKTFSVKIEQDDNELGTLAFRHNAVKSFEKAGVGGIGGRLEIRAEKGRNVADGSKEDRICVRTSFDGWRVSGAGNHVQLNVGEWSQPLEIGTSYAVYTDKNAGKPSFRFEITE